MPETLMHVGKEVDKSSKRKLLSIAEVIDYNVSVCDQNHVGAEQD